MSKWVNVKCTSVKSVMVEIADSETEEDAVSIAGQQFIDYEEFETHIVGDDFVNSYKAHADKVLAI